MDSFTQIVLGASVGEKFLGSKLGNRALLYGAIAGTIPDLDVLIGKFLDPISAIAMHRGFSHSILFFLFLSFLLSFILLKIEKKSELGFKRVYFFWFLGFFTHALLDAFTTWGTQLFFPFENRIYFHSIAVIDPMYTIPFAICLIILMRFHRSDSQRNKWNNIGLIISTSYLMLTLLIQFIVTNKFNDIMKQHQVSYNRKIIKPSPFNIVLWNAIYETKDGYFIGDYSFFDSKPISFQFFAKNSSLMHSYKSNRDVQKLIKISEGWWIIYNQENRIYFNDVRFGLMNSTKKEKPEFSFSYEFVEQNGFLHVKEVQNKTKKRAFDLFRSLIFRLKGN